MATTIYGTDGDNIIRQYNRPTLTVYAYGGNDTIHLTLGGPAGGNNTVYAGWGNDRVNNYFEGGNLIYLGDGNDTYVGTGYSTASGYFDIVRGGNGNDVFDVTTFQSDYYGDAGNDTFFSVGFNNLFNGGNGIDTISFETQDDDPDQAGLGIYVDLYEGFATADDVNKETLVSIENAVGTGYADTLLGTNYANKLWGAGGNDALRGFAGADRLYGEAGNDSLFGGAGNDLIQGGAGKDTLNGGTGEDVFVFTAVADSRAGSARDTIADFYRSEGDYINLSAIDANVYAGGNQAFDFIGTAAFSGMEGELRFAGGVLSGDVNGDGAADFQVTVTGLTRMYASDFVL